MTPINNTPSSIYQQRISALHDTKMEHTALKVELYGHFDTDDHGYIPWTEPIPFEVIPNHPSGGCFGPLCIGTNFRRWLEIHPLYIHPMSSMAGAWVYKGIPGLAGFDLESGMGSAKQKKTPRQRPADGSFPQSWRPEDRPIGLFDLFQKYHAGPGVGARNHFGPDMRIGLELGWGGLLAKIRHYRAINSPSDTDFYDGEEQLVLGVQTWIQRHVDLAREMAAKEEDALTRQNLLDIAEVNEWLIDGAPRTLREACQFLVWAQSIDRMWALGGALGQLDELLRPYYEADIAAGRETDDSVIWHLASMFFNDPHYSQIGGQAPDGRDLTSKMSFLILESMHRVRIPTNIALRVYEGMDQSLLRRALEYMIADGTGVDFALSGGLDAGFMKNGHPIELARMRAKVGCNWTALPGIEYCLQDVTRLCLITPMLMALDDMMADSTSSRTMDELWARYAEHLSIVVEATKVGKDLHMERQSRNYPEIVLNLFCHGPIERGLDVAAGGVDIVDLAFDAVGLATVADSFAAIEQRVVDEQRLSWEALMQHLRNDFKGAEPVRLMLNSIPRYGSGGSRADWWAERIADLYTHLVRDTPTPKGRFTCVPGLFSHGNTNSYGQRIGATPNGRHAGTPISHSADPDPGFLPGGAVALTAKANAVAATQSGWGNTTPLQVELDDKLVKSMGGIDAIIAFIMAHNRQGGTLINMNVVSKEKVLEAHADPATHPDLMIRVTGYSAYFNSLSYEYRQPIVDRILAEN